MILTLISLSSFELKASFHTPNNNSYSMHVHLVGQSIWKPGMSRVSSDFNLVLSFEQFVVLSVTTIKNTLLKRNNLSDLIKIPKTPSLFNDKAYF